MALEEVAALARWYRGTKVKNTWRDVVYPTHANLHDKKIGWDFCLRNASSEIFVIKLPLNYLCL